MSMWVEKKISDLGKVITGKTPPKDRHEFYDHGDKLFVSPKDLDWNQFYVFETETKITDKAFDKHKNQILPKNSVMFTSLSFAFGKMGITSEPCLTNQQINSIIVNENHDYRFVYYLLHQYRPFIFSYNSGIDTPIVPKSVFESIPVRCPTIEIQKKIAATLSAYDDLIENNNRRIALLESMAEEIYREWFIRLRFPSDKGGKVKKLNPKKWEKIKLPNLAKITYGFPFKAEKFNSHGMGKPIVRIRNIQNSETQDYTEETVSEKYLVKQGDILIGMDGEFHINHWYGEEAYLVQRVCKISPLQSILKGYLYRAIQRPIKHLESILLGATVGHLGAKHLNDIDILIPPTEHLIHLDIFNKLENQKAQIEYINRQLTKTKNSLLPRLISGKLSVEKLNIQLPPSMLERSCN